jgi:hypothetical protein
LSKRGERLGGGVKLLRQHRDGRGGWHRFPFYYTLLALSEIGGRGARREVQYAAPRLERMLKRGGRGGRFAARRRAVAERILAGLSKE